MLFVLFLLSSATAYSQESLDNILNDVNTEFAGKPYLQNAITRNIKDMFEVKNSFNDTEKFIKADRQFHKNRYCLLFLLDESTTPKFREFFNRVDTLPEMKDYTKTEFSLLMNRDIRHRVTDGITNLPPEQRHSLCEDKLPDEVVKSGVEKKKAAEAQAEANYKLATFEELHPRLRKGLISMRDEILKSPNIKKSDADEKSLLAFIGTVIPMLDTKAQLETFPLIEKKCPGKVEEIWKLCKGKKYFEDSIILSAHPGAIKMTCLGDHRDKIVPHCLDGNMMPR